MADPPAAAPYGALDREFARHLATVPANDDGAIWVVHLRSHVDTRADDGDGPERSAHEVVFAGDVIAQPDGAAPTWGRVEVVKYPTRRSLAATNRLDRAGDRSAPGSDAGEAIVIACIPSPTVPVPPLTVVPAWHTVPHPASDDDSPVTVMHVVRYTEGPRSPEDLSAYAQALAGASIPHGARGTRWFAVEGTLLGDGRSWDDVRFTTYPSCAAYLAVVDDLSRIAAYRDHRRHLVADQYTVVVRPTIDRIARSVVDDS